MNEWKCVMWKQKQRKRFNTQFYRSTLNTSKVGKHKNIKNIFYRIDSDNLLAQMKRLCKGYNRIFSIAICTIKISRRNILKLDFVN